jgi:hypothetical protein
MDFPPVSKYWTGFARDQSNACGHVGGDADRAECHHLIPERYPAGYATSGPGADVGSGKSTAGFVIVTAGMLASADIAANRSTHRVILDLTSAHSWGHSDVATLDKAILRFRRRGVEDRIIGLNAASDVFAASERRRRATRERSMLLQRAGAAESRQVARFSGKASDPGSASPCR